MDVRLHHITKDQFEHNQPSYLMFKNLKVS
jgi:hypothetical protein